MNGATNRARAGMAVSVGGALLLAGWIGAVAPLRAAEADATGVTLLRGFEIEEMKAFGSPGKFFPGHSPPGGYRVEPIPTDAAGYTIFRRASSRDWPKFSLFAQHATQGKYALCYAMPGPRKTPPLVTAHPPAGGYHDVFDWSYQRHGKIWSEDAGKKPLDWSAYDRLRFDVHSTEAPAVLGVRLRDKSAPRGRYGPHGIKTTVAVFTVPKATTVTCEFPLAEMARIAEADLSKIHWMHIRRNGSEGKTLVFIDNIRLLTKDAKEQEEYPLVTMAGEPRPFARKVWGKNAPPRARATVERDLGPVARLGPVTVIETAGTYACSKSHFGGQGGTYFQSARRGVVAFDNKRLLVVMGGRPPRGSRPVTWGGTGEAGGMLALASFDGGKTWGGLMPGQTAPVALKDWYWRTTLSTDGSGDLYAIGTQNCDSYTEGYDVFFRRLGFDGTGWTYDRFSIVDQNGYKCPGPARALRLAAGRIWAAWTDGFGGVYAKRSDDDGLTWVPCKDASVTTLPRPFYAPRLEDLGKPDAPKPPKAVLLWPADLVAGPLLVPFKGHVAAIAYTGSQWAHHDGTAWGATQKVPWKARRGGQASEAVLGDSHVFLVRAEGKGDAMNLVAMRLVNGEWKGPEALATGVLGSSILTASGDAVFCFYVLTEGTKDAPAYTIYCRRWRNGTWEAAEKVATETDPINRLAAPTVSPPSYAAVLWDERVEDTKKKTSWVRFARIPNR